MKSCVVRMITIKKLKFRFRFFIYNFYPTMSVEQDVSRILEGTVPEESEGGSESAALAKVEVSKLLKVSDFSMLALCQDIEQASTKEALRTAFRQLNNITRILLKADPLGAHNDLVRDALVSLLVSERLETLLTTIAPVNVALVQYKKSVVRDLAIAMRQLEATIRVEDELDAVLLSQLPEPA